METAQPGIQFMNPRTLSFLSIAALLLPAGPSASAVATAATAADRRRRCGQHPFLKPYLSRCLFQIKTMLDLPSQARANDKGNNLLRTKRRVSCRRAADRVCALPRDVPVAKRSLQAPAQAGGVPCKPSSHNCITTTV